MTYNKSYASKGAGAAGITGLALGATALAGVLSQNNCGNNGLLGGLFGGDNQCYVTQKEAEYMTALAIAQSEKDTAITSKSDLERLYQELRTQDAKIADGLIQTSNAVAAQAKEIACLQVAVDRNREEARFYTDTKVGQEAQLRTCEDEKIVLWAKGELKTKADYAMKIDIADLCGPSPLSSTCGMNSTSK